jgi:hypothetical protein
MIRALPPSPSTQLAGGATSHPHSSEQSPDRRIDPSSKQDSEGTESPRHAGAPEPARSIPSGITVHGDNAVVSQGQRGGITAQTVIIHQGASSRQATLRAENVT